MLRSLAVYSINLAALRQAAVARLQNNGWLVDKARRGAAKLNRQGGWKGGLIEGL
jgi:hypothetical protein